MPNSDFESRYDIAATAEDIRRIRRQADRFWRTVTALSSSWLQTYQQQSVVAAIEKAIPSATAHDVAMILDLSPSSVDFRTRASAALLLAKYFEEVTHA